MLTLRGQPPPPPPLDILIWKGYLETDVAKIVHLMDLKTNKTCSQQLILIILDG